MKQITSVRIEQDIINHLRHNNINISDYVNKLIIDDLQKKSLDDTILKIVLNKAIYEEKKSEIIQELKIVGAINNINDRIKSSSKGDEQSIHILLTKNIELLEIEFSNKTYSDNTKDLIKNTYKNLVTITKQLEPTLKEKKLEKKNEKKKKIKSV